MKKTAFLCAICGVTVALLMTAVSVVPTSTAPTSTVKTVPTTAVYRVIRLWEGQVAVFDPHSNTPERLYDAAWRSLPTAEQQRLRDGIEVENEAALMRALEDYLS